jgi:hypothetical protein
MKTLFSVLLLCYVITLHGQGKPIDRITQRMIASFEKHDTGSSFYRAIGLAATNAFDPRTTAFLDVWKQKEQQFPHASRLGILTEITDSVMISFYDNYLRLKTEKEFSKSPDVFRTYLQGMCPCIAGRVKKGANAAKIGNLLGSCEDSLAKDKPYIKKFQEILKKNSEATKDKKLGSIMTKYLLLTCYDLYEHSLDYILTVNLEQYVKIQEAATPYLFKRPTALYQRNMMDSLVLFFPDYKKYENDIRKVIALGNPGPGYIVTEGPVKASDTQGSKVLLLFNLKNGEVVVVGQLAFSYTRTIPIKILSYSFTPVAQMKNLADVSEKIAQEIDDTFLPIYENINSSGK